MLERKWIQLGTYKDIFPEIMKIKRMTIIIYAVGNSYKDMFAYTVHHCTVRPIFEMLSTSRGSDRVYPETLKNRTPNVAGAL